MDAMNGKNVVAVVDAVTVGDVFERLVLDMRHVR